MDWGCDFAHPNFLNEDGSTRLLALWDQRGPARGGTNPYGYGTIHRSDDINRALGSDDPYDTLGYHPASDDPDDTGAHGTHVMDIAAGNGRAGGPVGVAPDAALVFVHLSSRGTEGLANLVDSVALLEAVDFIRREAGECPVVINLSMGSHGGPHDGCTLVELGLDAFLTEAPGRCICQSTGNYFRTATHVSGVLRAGERRRFTWWTDAADVTPNELELWYSGQDRFVIELSAPQRDTIWRVPLGERAAIEVEDEIVGRIYHRAYEPNNGDHNAHIFLYPSSPAGAWRVTVIGQEVVNGRFDAWVERDATCDHCQSRFNSRDADARVTTGTICNGRETIVVGAYNAHSADRGPAAFSSVGPTRDGRPKPDLGAPGVLVLAARSASRDADPAAPWHTRKSGTSMASPSVAGTCALIFEAAGRSLSAREVRAFVLDHVEIGNARKHFGQRLGRGYLDTRAAVEAARALQAREPQRRRPPTLASEVERGSTVASRARKSIGPNGGASLAEAAAGDDARHALEGQTVTEQTRPQPVHRPELDEEIVMPQSKYEQPAVRHPEDPGSVLTRGLESLQGGCHPDLAEIFDAFAALGNSARRRHFESIFEPVALPGRQLRKSIRRDDLFLRRALGEGRLTYAARIASGEARSAGGPDAEPNPGGMYMRVVETRPGRTSVLRRIADEGGFLPREHLILRVRANLRDRDESEGHSLALRTGTEGGEGETEPEELKAGVLGKHSFKCCSKSERTALNRSADRAIKALNRAESAVGSAYGRPDKMSKETQELLVYHLRTTRHEHLRKILDRFIRITQAFEKGIEFTCERDCEGECGHAYATQLFGGFGNVHICFDTRYNHCHFTNSLTSQLQDATIIHEVAHRYVGIKGDTYHPSRGYRPAEYAKLTAAEAMDNADSYAFFAVELQASEREEIEEVDEETKDEAVERAEIDANSLKEEELDVESEFEDLVEVEVGDDEANSGIEARALDPVLVDLAEKIMAREGPLFEQQVSPRWTRCFSAEDIARVKKVYEDNASARSSNSDDSCSCIVMLNVALGQLLSLPLKQHPARSKPRSNRRVQMGDLTTDSIEKAMQELRRNGFARAPTVINFFDRQNRTAGRHKPERLKASVRDKVLASSKTEGCWFAFGLSIFNGYHSVLLLVDHTAADAKIYWLDQFRGGLDDDVTASLDQRLTDKTQAWWQAVMDEKGKGWNTRIRLWQLGKPD